MKRLPVDVSDFKSMIENDYIYVDKTKIVYSLLQTKRLFFLSRPRRFGKSLLISTLYQLFSGNKELFKNTWIGACKDYLWDAYPIIFLDFSILNNHSENEFADDVMWELEQIAMRYNIDTLQAPSLGTKLKFLVTQLASQNKVVVLIDEYDYPLLSNITRIDVAKKIHRIMRDFFTVIKGLDGFIHSVFITGVTKFSKTSIFSGMNNLNDLSMSEEAACLLGYTEQELKEYFDNYITTFAARQDISTEHAYEILKNHYNGYCFSDEQLRVYNPYSILHCLAENKLQNYWFTTGTPSFLIELLRKENNVIKNIEQVELHSSSFGSFDLESIHALPVLFQMGYLTIKEYDKEKNLYVLGYPNAEVHESFTQL